MNLSLNNTVLNTVNFNNIQKKYSQNSTFAGNTKLTLEESQLMLENAGFVDGFLVYCLTYLAGNVLISTIYKKLNPKENIPDDKTQSVVNKMVQESGLSNNGFKYFVIDKNNKKEILAEIYKIDREKMSDIKKELTPPEWTKKRSVRKVNKAIRGRAGYFPSKNYALVPKNRFYTLPHETGHAVVNKDVGYNLKLVNVANLLSNLLILLTVLSSSNAGKSKSLTEKIKQTIKKHAVAATLLCSIPQLVSECLASKIALDKSKDVLDKDQQDLLKKKYIYAFSTYVSMSMVCACAAKLALLTKNKVAAMKFIPHLK